MVKSPLFKWTVSVLVLIGILFFVLPNLFNHKERQAFSDEIRLNNAIEKFSIDKIPDSITVSAGDYYRRSGFHLVLYGEKYRSLWAMPVKVKVFNKESLYGGLEGENLGGGMQTIGMDMISTEGKAYDLRSVNKDQSKALPVWLQYSYARVMFRDQVAALNPYASLVIPTLAEAVGIMHSNPLLVFVPYDSGMDEEFANAMAGRLAIIEEKPDETWANSPVFNKALRILDTEVMMNEAKARGIAIDTTMFLRCRLFDIFINDWDRHQGQWEWGLVNKDGQKIYQPIPKDRDMAFYKFNEGFLSFIALMINPKFQSFTSHFDNVEALTSNSRKLDESILGNLKDIDLFIAEAEFIKQSVSDSVIEKAFKNYPPEIFEVVGKEHIEILKSRRDKLSDATIRFYEALQ